MGRCRRTPASVPSEVMDRRGFVVDVLVALATFAVSAAILRGSATHLSHIMTKFYARDPAQLVVAAYESGLVRPGM